MNSGRPWSGILFAFVIGVIVGGLATAVLVRTHVIHVMRGGRPPLNEVIGKRVTEKIDLTADERAKLAQILKEYEPAFRAVRERSRAEIQRTADEMEQRIREILSPEQQARFDRNVARVHEELRKRRETERSRGSSGSTAPDSARP